MPAFPSAASPVLLKGINDNVDTMKTLYHGLLMRRVKPYYLYQCDSDHGFVALPHAGREGPRDHGGVARPHHRLRQSVLRRRCALAAAARSRSSRISLRDVTATISSFAISKAGSIATPDPEGTLGAEKGKAGRQLLKTAQGRHGRPIVAAIRGSTCVAASRVRGR